MTKGESDLTAFPLHFKNRFRANILELWEEMKKLPHAQSL